jgi:alpha-glucosidase
MPISRALFLNDPSDPRVYDWVDSEFFVGRDMLVAPIVTRRSQRQIYLPAGSAWYSFKDNREKLDVPIAGGGPPFDCVAPLDHVPIYIRAGAILPMRELEQYVGELPNNPLTINIYPGPDSTYQLYQDDGITGDAENERAYRLTEISHQSVPGGRRILVRRSYDRFTPSAPFFFVALLDTVHPSSVTISGALVPDVQSPEHLAAATSDAYYWNADIGITFIKVFDRASDLTVTSLHN